MAADAAVFGPAEPDDAAVARVWQLVAAASHAATAGLPLRRRLWGAVNPVSLWASRATLERLRPAARAQAALAPRPGPPDRSGPPRRPGP